MFGFVFMSSLRACVLDSERATGKFKSQKYKKPGFHELYYFAPNCSGNPASVTIGPTQLKTLISPKAFLHSHYKIKLINKAIFLKTEMETHFPTLFPSLGHMT